MTLDGALAAVGAALEGGLQLLYRTVPPAWLLAVLLALAMIFLFKGIAGREGHSSLYFLPWGIIGFALGNLVGTWTGSRLPSLGDVRIIEACLGAWLLLTIANLRQPA